MAERNPPEPLKVCLGVAGRWGVDQYRCYRCGLIWDVDEPRPACILETEATEPREDPMKALKYDINTFTTRDEARTFLIDNGFVPSSEKTEYGRWVRILDDTDISADTDIERVEAYRNQSGTYTVAKCKPRTSNTVYITE